MPTRKNKEIWKEIEKIIEEEIKKNNINEKELLTGIYYLNGNDGTTFDIAANERLSEIGKLYKNEYYAVKLFLQKNGDLKIFSYPNLENLQEHVKRLFLHLFLKKNLMNLLPIFLNILSYLLNMMKL